MWHLCIDLFVIKIRHVHILYKALVTSQTLPKTEKVLVNHETVSTSVHV